MNELLYHIGDVFHDQDYQFDPDSEEMFYSKDLKNGMIVLINAKDRVSTNSPSSYRSVERNRWCEVTKFHHIENSNDVVFVGLYADRQQVVRRHDAWTGWHVKKASIPAEENVAPTVVDDARIWTQPASII